MRSHTRCTMERQTTDDEITLLEFACRCAGKGGQGFELLDLV